MSAQPETIRLVRYDAMVHAIAECHSIDEVADLRNKARALEIYAKQAQNVDAERKACEIRLRAERKAGELLKALPRDQTAALNGGSRQSRNGGATGKSAYASALEASGISPRTANRYQELAAVSRDQFEAHLDGETKPTTNGILRAANGSSRMDDGALWLWGRIRDFEREGRLDRNASDLFGAMTETMQADVRRVLPRLIDWLEEMREASDE